MVERKFRIKLKKIREFSFSRIGSLKIIRKLVFFKYFIPLDVMKAKVEDIPKNRMKKENKFIFPSKFTQLNKEGLKFISAFDISVSIYKIRFFIEQKIKGQEINDNVEVYITLNWKDVI